VDHPESWFDGGNKTSRVRFVGRVQDGAKDALVYRHQVVQRKRKKGEMVK